MTMYNCIYLYICVTYVDMCVHCYHPHPPHMLTVCHVVRAVVPTNFIGSKPVIWGFVTTRSH